MKLNLRKSISLNIGAILFMLLFSLPSFAAEKKSIGVVMSGNIPYYIKMHKAFLSRLAREGYGNVDILLQKPYPDQISWSNAARKFIAMDVDIIVTFGASATIAAIQEKSNIPIVYAGVHYSSSLGPTGKNVTGSVSKVPTSSLLRYLKGITPISNLGVLYSDIEKDCLAEVEDLDRLSRETGFRPVKINIRRPEDVRAITSAGKLDALFLTCSVSVNMALDSILDIAKSSRMPTASLMKADNSGVIVTLSASPEEQGEMAADKVIKILKGAHPGSIAQTSGKNIELIFNLKENLTMGLKIPMDLVTEATKIIQ